MRQTNETADAKLARASGLARLVGELADFCSLTDVPPSASTFFCIHQAMLVVCEAIGDVQELRDIADLTEQAAEAGAVA